MAEIYDFPIPNDPAMAEFAYAVLKFIEAQNQLNLSNLKTLEDLGQYVSTLDDLLGDLTREVRGLSSQPPTPPTGK